MLNNNNVTGFGKLDYQTIMLPTFNSKLWFQRYHYKATSVNGFAFITETLNEWRGVSTLQWRHDERYGVSNHQPHDCLLSSLFSRRSKKTSKLRVTGLCEGNSPVTGEFPAQKASNAENVSIYDVIMNHLQFRCMFTRMFRQTSKTGNIERSSLLAFHKGNPLSTVDSFGVSNWHLLGISRYRWIISDVSK